MFYLLVKNWIMAFIGISIFIVVIINPYLITKYGVRTITIDNIVRIFAMFLLLIWLIPHKSLLLDTVGYLKNGEQYIQIDTCIVSEIQRTTWFFFAQKSLICENNKSYVDRFTSRFYSKNDKLEIKYLPKTTLIINIEKID